MRRILAFIVPQLLWCVFSAGITTGMSALAMPLSLPRSSTTSLDRSLKITSAHPSGTSTIPVQSPLWLPWWRLPSATRKFSSSVLTVRGFSFFPPPFCSLAFFLRSLIFLVHHGNGTHGSVCGGLSGLCNCVLCAHCAAVHCCRPRHIQPACCCARHSSEYLRTRTAAARSVSPGVLFFASS